MSKQQIRLTPRGLQKIKDELKHLREVKRAELAEYMGKAIEDGDLSESAAYDEARLLQGQNEARIADLEEIVHRAQVVEVEAGEDAAARLGASLVLENGDGAQVTYHLVGTHEVDIFENRISDESPLGQQLVGKRAGDQVSVPRRSGAVAYRVLSVTFE